MGSGASGKGTSQAKTTQTAYNQQTGVESGIALGAYSSGNKVNVMTSDPETVKNALLSNAATTSSALNFADSANRVAARTNEVAVGALENTAALSIYSGNDLATKFMSGLSDQSAREINLLQSLGQNNTDVTLASQQSASRALDQSFAVSKSVAPQDPSFALESVIGGLSKTALIVVGLLVAGVVGFAYFRKRA